MSDGTIVKTFIFTGYRYAGVQYKNECWCGNSYGKYGDLPEASCGAYCPGNQSMTCGGYNAQRIFSTGLPGMPEIGGMLLFDFFYQTLNMA